MRRSHDAISTPNVVKCSRCSNLIELHTICSECGYYRGKPVIAIQEGI